MKSRPNAACDDVCDAVCDDPCDRAQPRARRRTLGRGGLTLLGAMSLALALAGCATDSGSRNDRTADQPVSDPGCSESGRADAVVRTEAVVEFAKLGKSCQPYELTSYPQNERETVWHVCCGGMALNFIFFPSKCVAHRGSGALTCQPQ